MEQSKYKRIIALLNEYDINTSRVVSGIINELKNEAETYKDVEKKLSEIQSEILWKYSNLLKFKYLFTEIREVMEKEKNDLKLEGKKMTAHEAQVQEQHVEIFIDGQIVGTILINHLTNRDKTTKLGEV